MNDEERIQEIKEMVENGRSIIGIDAEFLLQEIEELSGLLNGQILATEELQKRCADLSSQAQEAKDNRRAYETQKQKNEQLTAQLRDLESYWKTECAKQITEANKAKNELEGLTTQLKEREADIERLERELVLAQGDKVHLEAKLSAALEALKQIAEMCHEEMFARTGGIDPDSEKVKNMKSLTLLRMPRNLALAALERMRNESDTT